MKLRFPLGQAADDIMPGKWRKYGVGIDCHKKMVWACILMPDYTTGQQRRMVCKFATTPELDFCPL
jgi:hypothetical protein